MWFLQTNLLLILNCCKNVLPIHWERGEEDFLEFRQNSSTMLMQKKLTLLEKPGGFFCNNFYSSALSVSYSLFHIQLSNLCFNIKTFVITLFFLSLNALHKNEVFHYGLFSKCDKIGSFVRILSHFLNKSFMENIFFAVLFVSNHCNILRN